MLVALPLYLFGFFGRNHPLYDINIIYLTYRTNMALFGFSDISFDKGQTKRGPLAKLVGSEFERTTLRYPLDVGNYDKGHYVVFYVRQQKTTSIPTRVVGSEKFSTDVSNAGAKGVVDAIKAGGDIPNKALNAVKNGAVNAVSGFVGKITSGITGGINNLFAQKGGTFMPNAEESQKLIDTSIKRITTKGLDKNLRTTVLTTDAIALYMPDTLNYSYSQTYDQLSLGGEIAGQAFGAGQSAYEEYKKTGDVRKLGESLQQSGAQGATQVIGQGLGKLVNSEQTAAAFLARTGRVVNPMLEMIYKSPNFRTFQFDFTFYPRDEREALEVQKILERLRFHQAPEIFKANGTESSGFLVPPSEFDIKFYYAGGENPNIPQIATCVLTTIDINYAPNGFSAYEVPGENKPSLGRTGMPVAVQVTMQFQETTYLTKEDFRQDLATSATLSSARK
jgi:hypothetical protein